MTTRVLPPSEYPRLAGTEAETIWPLLTAVGCVVVVEDGDQIVGCHVLQPVLHAECLWIHPDHRKRSSAARRLWQAVQATIRERFKASSFATMACSDDIRALLAHVDAVRVPGEAYVVRVGGG